MDHRRPFISFSAPYDRRRETQEGEEPVNEEEIEGATEQQRFQQAGVPPPSFNQGQFQVNPTGGHPLPVYLVDPRQGPTPTQPDLRSQYEAIKSSVSSVILDTDFMLNENRSRIASSDREQAAVLARNGKFIETQLRLMQQLQDNYFDQSKVATILDRIHTVQKAQMRYIQEEYSSLQIGGQFGQQTKSIFKSIRRQTTVYTPALIDDIKIAVNLTGGTTGKFGQRPPRPYMQQPTVPSKGQDL